MRSVREERSVVAALAAVIGGLSAWIGLASLHESQNADSLLMVLVSLQRWTPFFWDQDRFGMLVPLAAVPIRSPVVNMVWQGWLTTSATLATPFLAARFLMGQRAGWIAAGAATNVLFLSAISRDVRFDWLVAQPYGVALALGFAGLLTAETGRWSRCIAGLFLLLLAHWVHFGAFVILLPAVVLCGRSVARLTTLTVLSAAAAALAAKLAPAPHTTTALTSISDWPHAWVQLTRTSVGVVEHPVVIAGCLIASALAALLLIARQQRDVLWLSCIALGVGAASWLAAGTSAWVHMNLYYPRYVFPSLMMFGLVVTIPIVSVWQPSNRMALAAAAIVLAAATGLVYGALSWRGLNDSLDRRFAPMSRDVVRAHASVIAGEYWKVWPAVFHASALTYREAGAVDVYGLTDRSAATDQLWKKPGTRILLAAFPGDRSIGIQAERAGVELTYLQRESTIELFAGTPR